MEGLNRVSGGDNPSRVADVIFVHGLDGDATTTWHVAKKPDTFWPKWLAEDFPNVGVWSLGYAVSSSAWKGHSMPLTDRATHTLDLFDLDGIGGRPIMFICHSLGGLLVKQLLRHAKDSKDPRWQAIIDQTRAIIFLSTPHSGADLASWLKHIGTLLRSTVSVEELAAHDPRLRELNQWYRNHSGDLGITTFVYCEKLPTGGVLVVNETTADPGIKGVTPIPLDEDHISICKPETRDAQVFRRVKRLLESIKASVAPAQDTPNATGPLPPVRQWQPAVPYPLKQALPLSWLHFSDLHIQLGSTYDRDVVLRSFLKAIPRLRASGDCPDLLFLTGDVAHSGEPQQYSLATTFLDELLQVAGVGKERLFVIPGNHDVNRKAGRGLLRTLSTKEESLEFFGPDHPQYHFAKLDAFSRWYNAYFQGIRTWRAGTTCQPLEVVNVGGIQVGVLLLNSALFSADEHDHGKLWLGRRCLDEAVMPLGSSTVDVLVTLVHHPLNHAAQFSCKEITW